MSDGFTTLENFGTSADQKKESSGSDQQSSQDDSLTMIGFDQLSQSNVNGAKKTRNIDDSMSYLNSEGLTRTNTNYGFDPTVQQNDKSIKHSDTKFSETLSGTGANSSCQVSFQEAYDFARLHGAVYAEVSALHNLNVQGVITEHIQHIYKTLKETYSDSGQAAQMTKSFSKVTPIQMAKQ